jgi:protein O-mannosyl-transferase
VSSSRLSPTWVKALVIVLPIVLVAAVYSPGLLGGFMFDDFPNIVDNKGVQPQNFSLGSLFAAALSSPASDLKRPLASLSFAFNYLVTGLDPVPMKVTNLVIHLLNGLLLFYLARQMIRLTWDGSSFENRAKITTVVAGAISLGWMLLPINLTAVLYVVQRMESLANIFVALGLIAYVRARQRLLRQDRGLPLVVAAIVVPTAMGLLAKETAVLLPAYALCIECLVFRFRTKRSPNAIDRRIASGFTIFLLAPAILGLCWLLPGILREATWATRDFNLPWRLWSELRIVVSYIGWTLFPTPHALSFYHDDFVISTGWLRPWTTTISGLVLAVLATIAWMTRNRWPLFSLGIAFFFTCHLLTATILPLELIYEHRNYFASFGLLLAITPLLLPQPESQLKSARRSFPVVRAGIFSMLVIYWTVLTASTAYAWGEPLRLAIELAARAPGSPRAQYELGRRYIIDSHYDPQSKFSALAVAPLERSAAIPGSTILPEQALILMHARMGKPIKDVWWTSMTGKLQVRRARVEDESSLIALTQCMRDGGCPLDQAKMTQAFLAALSHPNPGARLLAAYGDFAWNIVDDRRLGISMVKQASDLAPSEPTYLITLSRMYGALGMASEKRETVEKLSSMNYGGSLNASIRALQLPAKGTSVK